ncbi:MAG TPA: type II secretion system inner membrane protein GspF [Gammaproteobacteria bacterium]
MGAFEYTALDAAGKQRKGVLEGDTARQVRQLLREQGLAPLAVEAVVQRETRSGTSGVSMRRGVSATDLALITRQMATLVKAGLPLEETLHTTAQQTELPRLKSMMLAVRSRVLEGHTLADGLREFPHVFPELYISTVAAGEHSGHLDVVLERLADYTESRQQLRQKIQLALFYPAILSVVALLVTIALLTYVVPQVVQVFSSIGQELPLLTRALIALSDFLRDFGLVLLGLIIAAVMLFRRSLRVEANLYRFHQLLHRLPIIGRLQRGLNTARFARTLSILTASGVSVLEALRIAGEVVGSLPMRAAIEEATQKVREGASIAAALRRSSYFPPMTMHLIASGESSGKLEEMLERAAVNQERELETTIAALMGLFEPLLIVVMGAVVMVIVMAILLPIFDLNQLVH